MTPDEITHTTDTQSLWHALRQADAEGDDRTARLLRERLAAVTERASPETPTRRAREVDGPVLSGNRYQDSHVTRADVLGILSVFALLAVAAWFAIPHGNATTLTRQDITTFGGSWPFVVDEVTIICQDDGPVYELSSDGSTTRLSDDELADAATWVPSDMRAHDADGSPVSVSWVRSEARQICSR